MFTKYGYSTIGIACIISFLVIVSSFFINNNSVKILLVIVVAVFFVLILNFFRDPERTSPKRNNVVVSPADGKVLFVKEIDDKRFINEKAWMISVFMSPLNVHVNRIPISGTIEYLKYFEGKFVAAFEDKASDQNERMEIGISNPNGKVFFTQVAGMVARRIVTELNLKDSVNIGERFGMIKFGSRVDVVVNLKWNPMVKKDDNVKAGETILFELKN
jgi:phosphatidylserine decarboxylase